jgi:hypothetical protein
MERKRMSAALIVGAAAGALLVAAPAGAGAPQLEVTPTSGPVGTTITVSGNLCGDGLAEFTLYMDVDGDEPLVIAQDDLDAPMDGTWSGELVVPATATLPGGDTVDILPGDGYSIGATCTFSEQPVKYDDVDFEVTGSPTPTPSTTPPTTAPTSTPPPATPITDEPPFTG